MSTSDMPPQIEFPNISFRKIRNGTRGIVLQISRDYAAKILFSGDVFSTSPVNYVLRNEEEAVGELEYEFEINEGLYLRNLRVPEPIGVERIKVFEKQSYPALIMQYLPYPSGADLGYHEFEKARKLALKEIERAMDRGFVPGGDALNPNNIMYDRRNKQVYLIDFGLWEFELGEEFAE